ncbi:MULTISPECIES: DUF2550 domain-containing protein [unclassified Nocardioides]|uniref:DUF2550 domain-containing protein n=1 Tax=unclassified Nocardioides TaxID=2615069 RepID=UPI0006F319FF|nr:MULTISPECIES: DUF2550 domain-containing protein [unclassified Nocardioides]KQY54514.1 hypothetical protein ASD30_17840 [Nocardioides sp. Root140]KQZ66389.1 hypothetical protein ASD66_22920 [Nocardioides sp. Root151]KRF19589.1 hypothetical protein ASH02_23800 [Nocardioides sp. Soil796]
MPLWQWLVDSVGIILVLVVVYGVALVVRRRALSRNGGTFELSHRARSEQTGRGWVLGLGRYSGERLEWFRIFSLSPRPRSSWLRTDLVYAGRRDAEGTEQMSLYAEHVIVVVESEGGPIEFAMSPSSLMGFQSWLEAAPPGADWNQRRPRL